MKKFTNDEKYDAYKKRKILRIFIIVFGIATIVLAILSLILKFSCIYAVGTFLIMSLLNKYRDSLSFNNKKEVSYEKKK